MKTSKNIEHYKAKIIELADKLQEKEKECSYLSALKSVHEMRIESLEKQLNDDKRYKDLLNHIEQQDNKITSLIKQRDNYKNDYEYAEECFQAERNRRWELEEQLNKIKDIVKDDKNEFYEKCPLKVLHVDTNNDVILDKTENKNLLDDFEIRSTLCSCYQMIILIDKKNNKEIPVAIILGPVVSVSEFKMFDNFLNDDIMFIERTVDKQCPFEVKQYHIDLRSGKVYTSETELRFARNEYKKEIEAMQYFANKNAKSMFDILNVCSYDCKKQKVKEIADVIKKVKYAPFNEGKPDYIVGNQMQDFVFSLIAEELLENYEMINKKDIK